MNLFRQYLDVMVILLMGAGAAWGIEESVQFIEVDHKKASLYFQFVTACIGLRFLIGIVLAWMNSSQSFFVDFLMLGGSVVFAYKARRSKALKRTLLYLLAIGVMIVEYRWT